MDNRTSVLVNGNWTLDSSEREDITFFDNGTWSFDELQNNFYDPIYDSDYNIDGYEQVSSTQNTESQWGVWERQDEILLSEECGESQTDLEGCSVETGAEKEIYFIGGFLTFDKGKILTRTQ